MISEDVFIRRTYNRFLMPTVFALLGTTFSAFGNTILAGNILGKEVLGVMNIMSSFTFLFAMFGCLISIGAASRSSIAIGRGDYDSAGKYEWLALVLSIALPVVISLPCLLDFRGLFLLLGGDAEDYYIGASYGKLVIAFGFLNTLMYFPFNFLRMIGKGRYGMYSFGVMGILDVVLVYVFLKLGMGPAGVALGSIISMIAANAAGLYFLFSKNSLFRMIRPPRKDLGVMFTTIATFGGAAALNNLCKVLRTVAMNLLVVRSLGQEGLQSLAVGCSIINLASASVTGFGQAASPIIGVLYGERDMKGQRQALRISVIYSLVFHTLLAVIIMLFASQIAALFGISSAEHITRTAFLIRLVAVSLIPASVMNVMIYYYTAIGEYRCSLILTVMHGLVLVVAITAVCLRISPSDLYGTSFIFAELLDFGIMAVLRIRKKPEQVYAEKFFSTVSDGTEDGAVNTSRQVTEFCEENDVSPALCMKLPLVVEELLVILARHCAADRSFRIDVRISLAEGKVLMRLRCEGATFNPIEWYRDRKERLTPEELMEDECFGMNVVDRLVNDVKYSSIFDVNNLIVTMDG